MTRAVSSSSPVAGFTLIELLVSLALMAAIIATMSAITLFRPIQVIQKRLLELDVAEAIVAVVARDLEGVVRLPLMEVSGTPNALFWGSPDGMRFSAVVLIGFRRTGLREVVYQVAKQGVESTTWRRIRLRRFSRDDAVAQQDLINDRFAVRFRYLLTSEDRKRLWSSHFNEPNTLPIAVKIEVSSKTTDQLISTRTIQISDNEP